MAVGQQLGHYQVLSLLGAGGMGEAYRARDARLERDVAIKVLPAALAGDADRLRRFQQEARAVAALNHPNIISVFELGMHQDAPYVVSELLEGETLRARLRGGPIAPRKAIEYAQQIARGLAAAHDKGIVHRDLKPENVFLTHDGTVKVLDFGLAKLTRPEASEVQTSAPTLPSQTDPGTVMGTMGYMSPEQVRGMVTDHRTDIFALGAIFYEMLTGARAFQGVTPADTASAILREDPPEIPLSSRSLPPGVEHILRHCLEKNPAERFQSARDLAFDLERLSGISGATSAVPALPAERARASRKIVLAAAALVLLAAAAFFAGRQSAGGGATAADLKVQRLTFRRGFVWRARFAPDGQTIVYGGAWDDKPMEIFSTRSESPESRALGMEGADLLAISSTGELAISLHNRFTHAFATNGMLARAPLAGGAPREVLAGVAEADWSPDGSALAVVRNLPNRAQQLEFPLGKVLYKNEEGFISNIRVSPQGDRVAFLDHPEWGDDYGFVSVVDLAGKKTQLTENWSERGLAWSPGGREIWYTAAREAGAIGRPLHAVSLTGEVRTILRDVGALTLQDISHDGRVLLTHESERRGIVAYSAGDTQERDWSWFDRSYARDISADGKTILFDETGEGAGKDYTVYLRKLDGSPAVRLGDGHGVSLSPDGKWAVASRRSGEMLALPTGAGEPRKLATATFQRRFFAEWFPDGKRLLLVGAAPGKGARMYVVDFPDGKPRPIAPEGHVGRWVSPDGKSIAGQGPDGRCALYPVDGGTPQPRPCFSGQPLRWAADGRTLFVREGQVPARIYRLDLATGRKELWKEIRPSDPAGTYRMDSLLITPDGKTYAYTYRRVLSDLYMIEGLK